MQTIDEISIGRDGDMFTLTIYHYPYAEAGETTGRTTFLIGLPDQFHAETQRTIGQWLTRAVELPPGGPTPSPGWSEQFARAWPYQPDALTHDAQDIDLARDLERGK